MTTFPIPYLLFGGGKVAFATLLNDCVVSSFAIEGVPRRRQNLGNVPLPRSLKMPVKLPAVVV
jgi:hypothetical protein